MGSKVLPKRALNTLQDTRNFISGNPKGNWSTFEEQAAASKDDVMVKAGFLPDYKTMTKADRNVDIHAINTYWSKYDHIVKK